MNFIWNPAKEVLDRWFEKLKVFKAKYGHCNIPNRYKANPKLANWDRVQRQAYKKGKLDKEKAKLLEKIGFVW